MPNRAYQRGANFERAVIKKLEAEGWRCQRSAGSHGPADIWMAKRAIYFTTDGGSLVTSDLLHIQCKLGPVTGKDKRILLNLCRGTGGRAVFATRIMGQIIMREITH